MSHQPSDGCGGNGSAASTEAVRGGAGAVLKAAPCQGVIFLWLFPRKTVGKMVI